MSLPSNSPTSEGGSVREEVVRFGPDRGLVGVFTHPVSRRTDAPTLVMWNVGLNHRVGPARAWVDLARRAAQIGVSALRFDVGGLGDSVARPDGPSSDIERAKLDLEHALDFLASQGESRFVLVSNCSGTDASHPVAVEDERVVGGVFLDGYAYPTRRFKLYTAAFRYLDRSVWLRAMRWRYYKMRLLGLGAHAPPQPPAPDEVYVRDYPSRESFERGLRAMTERGMRLLYIFSGETFYAYTDQFWDWLDRKDWGESIEVEFYPRANHTYSYMREREIMLRRVVDWVGRSFG